MPDSLRLAAGRVLDLDLRIAQAVCAAVAGRSTLALLRGASRLGDGWLSLAAVVVLLAGDGAGAAGRFAAAAIAGLLFQKAFKTALARTRPCFVDGGPAQRAPIPDAGSFPSGHTLHATLAMVAIAAHVPAAATVFVPAAVLIAWSRVALGVHYPSDVAAGAALGAGLGGLAAAL